MMQELHIRGFDKFGSGAYGAPRGDHTHHGVDLVFPPGSEFQSLNGGTVTKLGYAYKADLSYRYVQVTDDKTKQDFRYFYVLPGVKVGDKVAPGDVLGEVQDLNKRYPGITNHIHFEIMQNGCYINPMQFLEDFLE